MKKTKNTYKIPVRKQDRSLIISDPNAHSDFLEHGLDFLLPENTEILASQKGEIVDVKVDSNKGGFEDKYMGNKYLNFITIKHSNEEYSQYAHLKHNGAKVKVGQKVKAGKVIGYSGNTGYSSAPHLHFHVLKINDSEVGWETLKPKFDETFKVIRKDSDMTEKEKKILQESMK
ncbi:MAG: M23 family metallopeptidase [archaeon]